MEDLGSDHSSMHADFISKHSLRDEKQEDAMISTARNALGNSCLVNKGLAYTLSATTQVSATDDWTRALAIVEEVSIPRSTLPLKIQLTNPLSSSISHQTLSKLICNRKCLRRTAARLMGRRRLRHRRP